MIIIASESLCTYLSLVAIRHNNYGIHQLYYLLVSNIIVRPILVCLYPIKKNI